MEPGGVLRAIALSHNVAGRFEIAIWARRWQKQALVF